MPRPVDKLQWPHGARPGPAQRHRGRLAAIAALGLALALPSWAAAAQQSASGGPALARSLSLRIASQWPSLQSRSGEFEDYVKAVSPEHRDVYGPAMLGSALVSVGVRTGRADLTDAGLRSIAHAVKDRAGLSGIYGAALGRPVGYATPFSMLAMADVWNTTNRRLPRTALARLVAERYWSYALKRAAPLVRPSEAERPVNQVLLERVEWKAVLATHLPSAERNAVLARPVDHDSKVRSWVTAWLAQVGARRSATSIGSTLLISDPPSWPHSYHALSLGLMARLTSLSSPGDKARLMPALREGVRASRLLASPDGDVSYAGRSTAMPWVFSFTAYAALLVAADPNTASSEARVSRAFARRLLVRLRDEYLTPSSRLLLVPAMRDDMSLAISGLDPYPCATGYVGLALLGLEWAGSVNDGAYDDPADGRPVSGSVGGSDVASALGAFRSPSLWVGLRGQREQVPGSDLRYDLGPLASKQLVRGSWQWLLPIRPRARAQVADSWLSLDRPGATGLPKGRTMSIRTAGASQTVDFLAGETVVQAGVEFEYATAPCGGLKVEVNHPTGTTLNMSFWLPSGAVTRGPSSIRVGDTVIEGGASEAKVVAAEPSASHAGLDRVRLSRPGTGSPWSVSVCRV